MLSHLSILLILASAPAPGAAWRLSGEPADSLEAGVRDAASVRDTGAVDALRAAARQAPDSVPSGLAHLAAGLRLLDQARHADAIAELTHADVARTLLRDYALEACGEAQERLGQSDAAARSYLAAAAEPSSAAACTSLPRAARLLLGLGRADDAVAALQQVVAACPRGLADSLLALGDAQLARGDASAAAAAYDRVDRELPGSPQAAQARSKLRPLADRLPARSAADRAQLALARGNALLAAGRSSEALPVLQSVTLSALPTAEADLARVSLGSALLAKGRAREAVRVLQQVAADSPQAAHAAFLLARERAKRTRTPEAFEAVAGRYRGSPWAEEALLSLANHYQKDALDAAALPWWRRLLSEYPDGRYVERAAWRSGWADFRAGRYEVAARILEDTARVRPASSFTSGLLYWAGRSRAALGQNDRARLLLQETVRRYKHSYHGLRARDSLARLGGASAPGPSLLASNDSEMLPEPRATRARQLLLIERPEEAARELRLLPQSPRVQATLAWLEWRQGHLRPALVAMKRAYPEWVGEAGDRLPLEVWRILFPLRYEPELRAAAAAESLDPALVAALILQESTFDAAALSRAGARGLMQVMPATGRRLARAKGQRLKRAALHDPGTSLDFGARYLRLMSERFGGSVEKTLAAYNAGPHRVDSWTAERGERGAEDFIEDIPFTETRQYVMIILANREHYRRIYGLARAAPGPVVEGARP